MNFLLVLGCTVVLVLLFRRSLKKYPMVFYAGAVALTALYVGNLFMVYPGAVRSVLFLLMQKCTLSLALFMIVMFIGVFKRGSKPDLTFRPIRAELSILACLLSIGHVCVYLMAFAPRFFGGTGTDTQLIVFALTVVALLVLLVVLGVTSLSAVKRRMDATSWVKLQKWSYIFFGLIYLHFIIILLPSVLAHGVTATVNVVVYTVLFGSYAALRVRRAIVDKKIESSYPTSVREV